MDSYEAFYRKVIGVFQANPPGGPLLQISPQDERVIIKKGDQTFVLSKEQFMGFTSGEILDWIGVEPND